MYHACWQTQRPRLGQPCNEQAPPHLFFDFLKQLEHLRSLSIPTSKQKSKFPHLTLLSFLLRKELGSSLESFSKTHGSTPQKENNTPSHFFFLLSQRHYKTQILSQALYLSYFQVQPLGKGSPFMQEWFYVYFPHES